MNATTVLPTRRARIRAIALAPVAHVDRGDLAALVRVVGVLAILGAAFAVQTWSRTEVRQQAVALASARSSLAKAETLHERLVLERSVRRQPAHLQDEAVRLGLVAPVVVVEAP